MVVLCLYSIIGNPRSATLAEISCYINTSPSSWENNECPFEIFLLNHLVWLKMFPNWVIWSMCLLLYVVTLCLKSSLVALLNLISIALSHTPIMVVLCFNSIWMFFQISTTDCSLLSLLNTFALNSHWSSTFMDCSILLLHWLFSVLTIYLLLPPVTITGCSLLNLFADCFLPPLPST